MAQAQNTSIDAVSGVQPLSYLNQNQPATVLFVRQKRAPTTNDRRFKFSTMWLDTAANTVYALVNVSNNSAFWSLLGSGSSDLETLTGNSGGPLSPTGGNINIVGGQNVVVTGSGSTLTVANTTSINADSFETVSDPTKGLFLSTNVVEGSGSDVDVDITITPKGTGDTKLSAGSLSIDSVGEGLDIKEGANARMGTVTLASGNATVPTTAVTANSRIFLTYQLEVGLAGNLKIISRIPGTSFNISTGNIGDTSIVAWMIVEPA